MPSDELEVLRAANEVESDAVDRELADRWVSVSEVAEVRLQDEARVSFVLGHRPVGTLQCCEFITAAFFDQDRLVQLDPLGARGGQPLDEFAVDLDQPVKVRRQGVETRLSGLAEPEQTDRADKDGFGSDTGVDRFTVLI
jgi:hypothetical protein